MMHCTHSGHQVWPRRFTKFAHRCSVWRLEANLLYLESRTQVSFAFPLRSLLLGSGHVDKLLWHHHIANCADGSLLDMYAAGVLIAAGVMVTGGRSRMVGTWSLSMREAADNASILCSSCPTSILLFCSWSRPTRGTM